MCLEERGTGVLDKLIRKQQKNTSLERSKKWDGKRQKQRSASRNENGIHCWLQRMMNERICLLAQEHIVEKQNKAKQNKWDQGLMCYKRKGWHEKDPISKILCLQTAAWGLWEFQGGFLFAFGVCFLFCCVATCSSKITNPSIWNTSWWRTSSLTSFPSRLLLLLGSPGRMESRCPWAYSRLIMKYKNLTPAHVNSRESVTIICSVSNTGLLVWPDTCCLLCISKISLYAGLSPQQKDKICLAAAGH